MQEESILQAISEKKVHNLNMIVEEMPADLETPVSAFLKLRDFGAKFLLESVESGTVLGRYSFIGIKPETKILINEENLILKNSEESFSIPHGSFNSPLSSLKEVLSRFRIEKPVSCPRLLGGAVGFINYDFVHFFEKIPDESNDPLNFPQALFYLTDSLLVFDHVERKLYIMCLAQGSSEKEAKEKLFRMRELLNSPLNFPSKRNIVQDGERLTSNFTKEGFCQTVLRVKEHIKAGDVYQLVLSQRLSGETEVDPFMIYRALRMTNPSPYM
ncbi:MAG: chorismate-binding protein, partial [Candidatus Zixiibacteriota bacterium]